MSISPAILIDRGNRVVQLEFVPNLYGSNPFCGQLALARVSPIQSTFIFA
jgi:hypothetical protein